MSQLPVTAERSSATANIAAPSPGVGRPPGRRRWLQFSLRAFLVVFTLVGLGLGWLGVQIDHARRQRSALKGMGGLYEARYGYELKSVDPGWFPDWKNAAPSPVPRLVRTVCGENIFADVIYFSGGKGAAGQPDLVRLSKLSTLLWLRLGEYDSDRRNPITDEDLACLSGLNRLKGLKIGNSEVTDAGLSHLAGLNDLEFLALWDARVTGAGFSYLSGCKRLKTVWLSDCAVTAIAARSFGDLDALETLEITQYRENDEFEAVGDWFFESCVDLKRLQFLTLDGTSVTGRGLRQLRRVATLSALHLDRTQLSAAGVAELSTLSTLVQLSVASTPISDEDLRQISRLGNLKHLDLRHTDISDSGLAEVSKLDKLVGLNLAATRISDSGLACLHSLKKLRWINVQFTRVTEAAVERLRKALPSAEIVN